MKGFIRTSIAASALLIAASGVAQTTTRVLSARASANDAQVGRAFDGNTATGWTLAPGDLTREQWVMMTLENPGDVNRLILDATGVTPDELKKALKVYVTYDPMNLGVPVAFKAKKVKEGIVLDFPAKYGAHVRMVIDGGVIKKGMTLREVGVGLQKREVTVDDKGVDQSYRDTLLPVDRRIEILLAQMTPAEKMELIREGWGIPGVPRLGIPDIKKVEAIHGYSYGTGATMYPQVIAMSATFNRPLIYDVAASIAVETLDAGGIQAWSPVLDVAGDPRWGRCEESFGEDPYLTSMMGGAWVGGYQSKGLMTTPKHFGAHGAPLGGRDSHDVGFNEREMREVHLVPFRHVFRTLHPQSVMMSYNDYMGVPVGKSVELLRGILRDEWGFDGFIVSDCGAIANMTSRKHYTAVDKVQAANDALRAGIATNCGDTYNDPAVIAAAENGTLDMEALDEVCRDMLRVMFRAGLFEYNPCRPLDWNKQFPTWQSPEHVALARETARQSIVLLKNDDNVLPIAKNLKQIAVIGPGAASLQLGDYSGKTLDGQVKSVLDGIRQAVAKGTKVVYEKGCGFTTTESDIPAAVKAAEKSDVVVLVLGDYSSSNRSEADKDERNTSGENHDLASLKFQGMQEELLRAVSATGTPVVLVAQIGRPYDLSEASRLAKAIMVNWLPGQEGGLATADVLFGDYNPAGRLPMTFPRSAAQLPLTYNFKTSGRRYEYADMEFYPLYRFGYGLSYTTFEYSDLNIRTLDNGNVEVTAKVTNTGKRAGDEVAQLYVTDMYASVKTRVMELKGFDRVTLQPGESTTVKFTLTPYDLSLLNVDMDRVVEPGEFKIMVGGMSPDFKATDRVKDSLGYPAGKGVTGTLDYKVPFAADYRYTIDGVDHNLVDGTTDIRVMVTNAGSLTDTGTLTMYVDGEREGITRHYELEPGQSRVITFKVDKSDYSEVTFTSRHKTFSHRRFDVAAR